MGLFYLFWSINALALVLIGISVQTRKYQYLCLAAVLSAPAFFWISGYPIFHFVPALFPLLLLISGYHLKHGKIPLAFSIMVIPFFYIVATVVYYRIFPLK